MKSETSFEAATFSHQPPRFFGAKLHEGTSWLGVNWPDPTKNSTIEMFVRAYERLKLEMDRLRKHEDEINFFARELQCRRMIEGDWKPVSELRLFGRVFEVPPLTIPALPWFGIPVRTFVVHRPTFGLAIWFYGLLCDYGRSFVRPLLWLLFVVVVGALVEPFYLSLASTLGAFGFRRELVSPHDLAKLTSFFRVFSGLQTIIGTVLLFLFGLAIRNRFRMK